MNLCLIRMTCVVPFLLGVVSAATVEEREITPEPKILVVNTALKYIDNYHPRLSEGISSRALAASISGQLLSKQGSVWLQTSYSGQTEKYDLKENDLGLDDSFSQYNFDVLSRFFISDLWYLDLSASHDYSDELLGTGIAKFRPASNLADTYSLSSYQGTLVYGSDLNNFGDLPSERLIKLNYSHSTQDFRSINSYSDLYDIARDRVSLEVRYRLTELTKFEAVFEYEQLDFMDETRPDNDLYRVLVGFEWRGSGKTRVEALIGGYQRLYDVAADRKGFLAEFEGEYFFKEDIYFKARASQRSIVGVLEDVLDTIVKTVNVDVFYRYREHIHFGLLGIAVDTKYEQVGENRLTKEFALGADARLFLLDYTSVALKLQRESLEDNFFALDYIQNKVELNWRYEF